uniref:FLZ-type domain-containing protein n=1 Tax=Ananas comosus var. bracteatus TaxID=296719 RepID=A0A6V7PI11_ANACO|nr:unnamed protein product [Ananas comosus var. bracteatus]
MDSAATAALPLPVFSPSSLVDMPELMEKGWGQSCRKVRPSMRFFFSDDDGNGDGENLSSHGQQHHFLDACFLCKRHISGDKDIFMYRGNAPFCSKECRNEQMEMDEALETVARRQSLQSSFPLSSPAHKNCAVNHSSTSSSSSRVDVSRRPTILNMRGGSPLVA